MPTKRKKQSTTKKPNPALEPIIRNTYEASPSKTTVTITDTSTVKPKTVKEVAAMFPDASSTLTQRWYGETFKPQYEKALAELRKLAR